MVFLGCGVWGLGILRIQFLDFLKGFLDFLGILQNRKS